MKLRWLRTVARGLIGVLFTVQMAVAAHACAASLRPHSQTHLQDEPSEAPAAAATATAPSCHAGAPLDPAAPNLCAEHCKYGQQIDVSKPSVPVAVLAALYVTPSVPETAVPRPAPATMSALVAAAPPHAILHCVYRI